MGTSSDAGRVGFLASFLELFDIPEKPLHAISCASSNLAHSGSRPTSPASPVTPASPASPPSPPSPPPAELPPDLLRLVLRCCDPDTLTGNVPLVCRTWRNAARDPSLWADRLSQEMLTQLELLPALGPAVTPGSLFLALRGRNLLRNPTFRRDANTLLLQSGRSAWSKWQRSAWVVTTASSDGVAWELPPAGIRTYGSTGSGLPPVPLPYPGGGGFRVAARVQQQLTALFGNGSGGFGNGGGDDGQQHQQGCLATPNDWCEFMQVVDLEWELQRRGLSALQAAQLLDAGLSLRLRVHVGCRWDCVGQFSVGLVLDEGGDAAAGAQAAAGLANGHNHHNCADGIPQLQSFVMRPSRHHFYKGHVCCGHPDGWECFEYTVPACPRGFRRAVVILRGRRAPSSMIVSPMPKYCGAKFAAAELAFV